MSTSGVDYAGNLAKEPIVQLDEVSKHYQQGLEIVRAVDAVSLKVAEGDFLSITGRSGSGKTTLLSLIGGLTAPTQGRVNVFGETITDPAVGLDAGAHDERISSLRAERIGFVFQFASLIPTLTALDNVRLPGLFASAGVSRDRAASLLGWVGLSGHETRYPAELSGGQVARVALARALANRPDLLLADEPTGNLDVETEREILHFLRDLNRDQRTTIVLVTHNPELAKFGNRHLVMHSGRLSEAH